VAVPSRPISINLAVCRPLFQAWTRSVGLGAGVTEWVYGATNNEARPAIRDDLTGQRSFSTQVERDLEGRWIAVVTLGSGESVSKVFDSERDALHYGEELAEWLSARREPAD
jgi:hypothetical protein